MLLVLIFVPDDENETVGLSLNCCLLTPAIDNRFVDVICLSVWFDYFNQILVGGHNSSGTGVGSASHVFFSLLKLSILNLDR